MSPKSSQHDATELCAQAFKLSVVAVIGVVLVGLIAVAGLAPHAAEEVKGLLSMAQGTAQAHSFKETEK